ncbi:30S ribosome-binding factor RbfA [Candidatus Palibaumannia cicadellinicola]|uniref:Ribosome-binding factor A n=1 Tax=Baumannia cicadellinicola subsp. Homalodisca coagulata TaxID=374463 RepID=RBFA_BAUCH|nr:30S ribosome-binding factor RbfA [Candidatus Baumannia cicadellinicola]Q1LSK9.1 RecName: Full=Ribosome-binding factor A [Baumannia cicadellinicola str. Hc (Homalodisca coagulata)]ABF14202.1 ribosome-binding factor A [Baumannia cicadellinicola str. Hc (Homalodisca coagulata)]MCJ7461970.1 30S ribosome-binding factor RbfA [Candidatus Baumannia cicadellinicola]MCJ7462956.1 30S ribosome-binding factor RbfA [Candidatus Baumannia cicadellinicola]
MANVYSRKKRIAHEIQKKINISLQHNIRDPRLRKTTISWVSVSHDLGSATVFVIFNGIQNDNQTSEEIKKRIKTLQAASGFIRYLLGKTMHLRIVPKLTFVYDQSLSHGIYIHELVNKIIREDHKSLIKNGIVN